MNGDQAGSGHKSVQQADIHGVFLALSIKADYFLAEQALSDTGPRCGSQLGRRRMATQSELPSHARDRVLPTLKTGMARE